MNTIRPPLLRPVRRGAPKAPGGPRRRRPVPLKRLVYTAAFTAVTVVSAIYGAGLKTRAERQEEVRRIASAPPAERILDLEARRAALVTQRRPLEARLGELRARIREQQQEEEEEEEKAKAAAAAAAAEKKGVVDKVK